MRTIVGLYDRFEDAQQVVRALTDTGIRRDKISLIANDAEGKYSRLVGGKKGQKEDVSEGAAAGAGVGAVLGGLGGLLVGLGALAIPGIGPVIAAGPIAAALAGAGIGAVTGGVVGALVDLGIPDEDAEVYAEGVRRGGTLVVAQVEDQHADRAVDIMNQYNPVDVKKRAESWRQNQQWKAFDQKAKPMTRDDLEMERSRYHEENIPVSGGTRDDLTFPVVEEELRVGKREVERGSVRINTYIQEKDVHEDVNLRSEHINVERRPVNREASEADFNAFEEGTMELKETSEEAIIDKRARVVEEVHVDKDIEEHTETIHETLRRKDVDVERTGAETGDWSRYEQMYRQDFQTRYGKTGRDFNYYLPAYRYGYSLRNDPRFRDKNDWSMVEREARTDWERRGGQGTWNEVKDAVRNAWESVKRR
jgi:uncharacterized protein (TIGR02271 family)